MRTQPVAATMYGQQRQSNGSIEGSGAAGGGGSGMPTAYSAARASVAERDGAASPINAGDSSDSDGDVPPAMEYVEREKVRKHIHVYSYKIPD